MGSVVSVVVPVYNVAPYLNDCLASVAAQGYRDLDVVMVDDGSTDTSAEVAAGYAAADSRFRLISQENQGLGAARNTGVDAATGEYLFFLDSDDTLPRYAIEALVSTLRQTGSDFVSGNVDRIDSVGASPSPMHRNITGTTVLRSHISRHEALINDRIACNKLLRRRFWDAHGLRFPEGVLHEDIPVAIPAHVLAESVDVIELPIYHWRRREGPDRSITQRREDVRALVDRFGAVNRVSRFLAERGESRIKHWYDRAALRADLWYFLRVLPDVGEGYRQRFLDLATGFLAGVDEEVIARLSPPLRVQWHLVRRRMLPELLAVVETARAGAARVVRRGLRRYRGLPFLDDRRVGVPRRYYRADDAGPEVRVHAVGWRDGRLRIEGHAYLPGAGAGSWWTSGRLLWLRHLESGRWVPLPTRAVRTPHAVDDSGAAYPWSGFSVTVDPDSLRRGDEWGEGDWVLAVAVAGLGGVGRGAVRVPEGEVPFAVFDVTPWLRVAPVRRCGVLRLRVDRLPVKATGWRFTAETLEIEVTAYGAVPEGAALSLCRAPGVSAHNYPLDTVDGGSGRFRARIPVWDLVSQEAGPENPSVPGEFGDRWRIEFTVDGVSAGQLAVRTDLADVRAVAGRSVVHAQRTVDGRASLVVRPPGPVVTGLAWAAPETLVIDGVAAGAVAGRAEVVLRERALGAELAAPVVAGGRGWRALIPLAGPVPAGRWELLYREPGGPLRDLPLAGSARDLLPLRGPGRELVAHAVGDDRAAVAVRGGSPAPVTADRPVAGLGRPDQAP